MVKSKICIIILFAIYNFHNLYGQDIHFSQLLASNNFNNPATSGFFNGDLRAMAIHRSQWRSVTVPFVTSGVGLDGKIAHFNDGLNSINAGLTIYQDKAGDGALQTLEFQFSPSYFMSLGSDSATFISLGLGIGYLTKSIIYSKLTFDNQYDGEIFNASLASGEPVSNDKASAIDAGFGLNILKRLKENFSITMGLSGTHINKPDLQFINGGKIKYGPRWEAMIIADYGVSKQMSLGPVVSFFKQKTLSELVAGSYLNYVLKSKKSGLQNIKVALLYRLNDAAILLAGAGYKNLNFEFSYDINVSEFDRATNKRGASEISVSYIFARVKKIKPSVPCLIY